MSQKEKRRKSNVKEEKGREGYDDIIYRTACFRLSTAEAEGSLQTLPWVSPISSPQALQSQLLSTCIPLCLNSSQEELWEKRESFIT